jgi:hypothetical protein
MDASQTAEAPGNRPASSQMSCEQGDEIPKGERAVADLVGRINVEAFKIKAAKENINPTRDPPPVPEQVASNAAAVSHAGD